MESLNGKNVLVVGATGGIGSALVKLLAGSGAQLFLVGRNAEKLAQVANLSGVPMERTFAMDISQPQAVNELKEKYFEQLRSIDILVNAAGIGIIKSMDTITEEEFMRSLNYNLYGPFLLVKAFLPAMKELKNGNYIYYF